MNLRRQTQILDACTCTFDLLDALSAKDVVFVKVFIDLLGQSRTRSMHVTKPKKSQ